MPEPLFREIHDRYGARMRLLAYRITRNEADAEDALQDALMRIYEKYGTFRHESSLWTWVYRVTQTSALMILKKRRGQKRIAEASRIALDRKSEMSRPLTPEHALLQARLLDALQDGLDSLIPSLRAPMRTYLCAELNQRELCEHTGLSLLATKARMHRARVTLRRRLLPHLGRGSAPAGLCSSPSRAR
ncbi:MAG: RNA polymerase sigma factor [Myxococcota bacterium]